MNSADLDWELEPPASDLVLSRCTVALALSRCNAALALSRCNAALALSRCNRGVGAVALSHYRALLGCPNDRFLVLELTKAPSTVANNFA